MGVVAAVVGGISAVAGIASDVDSYDDQQESAQQQQEQLELEKRRQEASAASQQLELNDQYMQVQATQEARMAAKGQSLGLGSNLALLRASADKYASATAKNQLNVLMAKNDIMTQENAVQENLENQGWSDLLGGIKQAGNLVAIGGSAFGSSGSEDPDLTKDSAFARSAESTNFNLQPMNSYNDYMRSQGGDY